MSAVDAESVVPCTSHCDLNKAECSESSMLCVDTKFIEQTIVKALKSSPGHTQHYQQQ